MPESGPAWRQDRYGFVRWCLLPEPGWDQWWQRIYVDERAKTRLLHYARFALEHRERFSPVAMPLHGVTLLYGPPGTGKSSLARGLAQRVAVDLVAEGVAEHVIFAEVDPHALPSQMLGESQRNTVNLLEKSLPELADKGLPVVAVIDEVNSLATRRDLAAGGRDPVDVMRATDAVLRGLDFLASTHTNVLLVATSNFVASIDEAILDRVDLAICLDLPDAGVIRSILADTLSEVPAASVDEDELDELATALVGRSGRDIRKLVLEAVVTRHAPDETLTAADLWEVLRLDRTDQHRGKGES